MKFEVKWTYWDEDEKGQVSYSNQYPTLAEATKRYEDMKQLSHIDYVRISATIKEYSKKS